MTATAWRWPATTLTGVDGDTLDAVVTRLTDLGFGGTSLTSFPVRLRLDGINAPRSTASAGARAKARVRELVAAGPCDVLTLKPYKYGGPAGRVGEWMARVTLPDGRDLASVLLTEGLAVPWDGKGARPNDDGLDVYLAGPVPA